jgi:hypothetical protein
VTAIQDAPDSHTRHRPLRAVSAAVDNHSLHASPGKHSCGGDSAHSSRRKGRAEASPISHEERRLQRELARRQLGLLPPEQRYMPASSRKGTDEAARRALVAHLQEVPELVLLLLVPPRRHNGDAQRIMARCTSLSVVHWERDTLSSRWIKR